MGEHGRESLPGLPTVPQAPLCLAGRGPFPWFWPEGTGPSDRCPQPSRQGLQPPRGSLVCFYNKMIGDTSVLISGLVLLGSLRGTGGGAWTGQGQGWGCQPRGGGPSSLGCLQTRVSPVPAPRELRELDPQSCAGICRCRGPLLAGRGQDVRVLTAAWGLQCTVATGAGGRWHSPQGQRDLGRRH